MANTKQPQVFLCHASEDKLAVGKLYERLIEDGVDAWFAEEKLLPGQDWQLEISKAVKDSDAIIVFLSSNSVKKAGFIQKEIKLALDVAREKPERTIYFIPARLDVCEVPNSIDDYQWVDLFEDKGYEKILRALQTQFDLPKIKNIMPELDGEKFRDYRKVFDRAAFRTPCIFETTLAHLGSALDDILAAIATGSLYSRNQNLLLHIASKSDFQTEPYRSGLERVVIYLGDLQKVIFQLENLLNPLIRQYLETDRTVESYSMELLISALISADVSHNTILHALKMMDEIDKTRNKIIMEINTLLAISSSTPLPMVPLSTELIIKSAEPEMTYRWEKFFVLTYEQIMPLITASKNDDDSGE